MGSLLGQADEEVVWGPRWLDGYGAGRRLTGPPAGAQPASAFTWNLGAVHRCGAVTLAAPLQGSSHELINMGYPSLLQPIQPHALQL